MSADGAKTVVEKGKALYRYVKANPSKTMRVTSAVSGVLLIVGGISGVVNIFNPLGAVVSAYNILFGFLIVATELKTWPIIGAFQKRVDKYFHLLSVAKGKGGFYCFIGFLAFIASEWSLARVCTLLVCIVGVFHLLGYPRQPDQQQGLAASDDAQHQTDGMEASAMSGVTEFAMKVMQENPEMVKQGLTAFADSQSGQGQSRQHDGL